MRTYAAIFLLFVVTACATPEQTLENGYKSASASVRGTTALLNRGAISSAEAARAETVGRAAKAGLDLGKDQLAKCRATPGAICTNAAANINLGAGLLGELETYLKAQEAK